MKLTAQIENEERSLQIKREGGLVVAEVDGRRYELTVREPEAGVYLLISGGRVYDLRVEREAARAEVLRVSSGNRAYAITLIDPKRLRAGQSAGASGDASSAQVKAVMPGKVVRVLVEQGATVEAGDAIVVVEAMKMQNELKSPRAGRVAELRASVGATVNAGDVLAVIE